MMNVSHHGSAWIKNWPKWIKETILLIVAISGFIITFRNDPYLYLTVIVTILYLALFRWLTFIFFSKKPPIILGAKETYRFDEHYRNAAVIGMAILVILLIASLLVAPSRSFLIIAMVGTSTATPTQAPTQTSLPTITPSPIPAPSKTATPTPIPTISPEPSRTPTPFPASATPTFTATPKCRDGIDPKQWQPAPRIENQPIVPGQPGCFDLRDRGIVAQMVDGRLEMQLAKISHEPKVNGIYTTFPYTYNEINFSLSVTIDKLDSFSDCQNDRSDGSCTVNLIFGLGDPFQLAQNGNNGKYVLFRVLETGADRLVCKTSGIIGTAGNCNLIYREPYSFESNQPHILRFRIQGNEIYATIDNFLVYDNITLEDSYIRRFWIGYRFWGDGEINATINLLEYSVR